MIVHRNISHIDSLQFHILSCVPDFQRRIFVTLTLTATRAGYLHCSRSHLYHNTGISFLTTSTNRSASVKFHSLAILGKFQKVFGEVEIFFRSIVQVWCMLTVANSFQSGHFASQLFQWYPIIFLAALPCLSCGCKALQYIWLYALVHFHTVLRSIWLAL